MKKVKVKITRTIHGGGDLELENGKSVWVITESTYSIQCNLETGTTIYYENDNIFSNTDSYGNVSDYSIEIVDVKKNYVYLKADKNASSFMKNMLGDKAINIYKKFKVKPGEYVFIDTCSKDISTTYSILIDSIVEC